MLLQEGQREIRCRHIQEAKTVLEEAIAAAPVLDTHRLRRRTKTGSCITVLLSTVIGTDLGDKKWCDYLFLCYSIEPPDLPTHCDGCNANFSICHALYCNKSGLVMNFHNKLYDRVDDLTGKSFTPLYVRNNPLIHQGCDVQEGKSQPSVSPNNNLPETTENLNRKGDLLIREIWQIGTDSI